jgi:hypothetical protein
MAPAQQSAYLSAVSPDFAKMNATDQLGYLNHLHGMMSAPESNPLLAANVGMRAYQAPPLLSWERAKSIGNAILHPFDTAASMLESSPSELSTNPGRAQLNDIVEGAGKLTDVAQDASLLLAPEAGLGLVEGVRVLRAARAAKLLKDAGEWQRINSVLGVGARDILTSPAAKNAGEMVINPGRAVASLGYNASDLQSMTPFARMNSLYGHLQSSGAEIEKTVMAATQSGTTLDAENGALGVLKGIHNPQMQEQMTNRLHDIVRELGIEDVRKATPEEAWQLRQALRSKYAFTGAVTDQETAANLSKQLGSAVSRDLKQAVPSLSSLDQQYSDLHGAVDAATDAVRAQTVKPPEATRLQKIGQWLKGEGLTYAKRGAVEGSLGYIAARALLDAERK